MNYSNKNPVFVMEQEKGKRKFPFYLINRKKRIVYPFCKEKKALF